MSALRGPVVCVAAAFVVLLIACTHDEDPEGARVLWEKVNAGAGFRSWRRAPGFPTRQPSFTAHASEVEVFVNQENRQSPRRPVVSTWPLGSIVVKEGYKGDSQKFVAVIGEARRRLVLGGVRRRRLALRLRTSERASIATTTERATRTGSTARVPALSSDRPAGRQGAGGGPWDYRPGSGRSSSPVCARRGPRRRRSGRIWGLRLELNVPSGGAASTDVSGDAACRQRELGEVSVRRLLDRPDAGENAGKAHDHRGDFHSVGRDVFIPRTVRSNAFDMKDALGRETRSGSRRCAACNGRDRRDRTRTARG